jgi:hypothetical protein
MQQQSPSTYFLSRTEEEENPIIIDEEISTKYFHLEQLFNSFFPNDSLSVAKEKSKEERDSKRINDSTFTYGEIVNIILLFIFLFIINLDFQIYGIYF